MSKAIALVLADVEHGFLGSARSLRDSLAGRSVLAHTVARAAQVDGVQKVVVVHPRQQAVADWLEGAYETFEAEVLPRARVVSGRKWCQTGWRGGLGSATIYDELLPAGPLVEAMRAHGAASALLVRGDWPCFDVGLASQCLERHLSAPDDLKIVFTQAAPGLGAVATGLKVLEDFAAHDAGFSEALGYNPRHAAADPVGKDVCVPCPTAVRDAYRRFVYDTPSGMAQLRHAAAALGDGLGAADAETIVQQAGPMPETRYAFVELTPERPSAGPIAAQHGVALERAPMSREDVERVVDHLSQLGDVPVMFGHLGDALSHPDWRAFVQLAHDRGVLGVGVETDLVCDDETLQQLVDAPLDVIAVRMNADTQAVYETLMGHDGFKALVDRLKRLFELRGERRVPWIVPTLVKTTQNVKDLESFFDRWKLVAGHAVIQPMRCGRDASGRAYLPDLSPVPMQVPGGVKWPGDEAALWVLSDGTIAADGDDWLGERALGHVREGLDVRAGAL